MLLLQMPFKSICGMAGTFDPNPVLALRVGIFPKVHLRLSIKENGFGEVWMCLFIMISVTHNYSGEANFQLNS